MFIMKLVYRHSWITNDNNINDINKFSNLIMKKKMLITGAAGFLGKLAYEYFKYEFEVIATDKNHSNLENFYKVDITNQIDVENIISKEKPDIIIHFASEIFDKRNKKQIFDVNVDGTLNLIKVADKYGVKNFIFTSTFSIYEEDYNYLVTEDEPPSCKNFYGLSKYEAEKKILNFEGKIDVVIFRCPVIVDKTRAHRLAILFEFIKSDATIWIIGDGENKIQIVSASDLFLSIKRSLALNGKNIFNIGSKNVLSLKETFAYLINKSNSKSRIRHLNKRFGLTILNILSKLRLIDFIDYHNKMLVSNLVMDTSKIEKTLGLKTTKTNADLMFEAFEDYNNNRSKDLTGSSKKPNMGFFAIVKFFSKFI